jgi:membrane associated rhomboid family serine protease
MFLHGGFVHLGGNMLYLWVFGDNVEYRFGHFRYLIFYGISGFLAVWAHVLTHPSSTAPIVGASGAIAGVLGAYLLLFPYSRVTTLFVVGFIFLARVPALILLGFYALLQVFSGIWSLIPENPAIGGVAYFAHLGGLVVGIVTAAIFKLIRKEPILGRPYEQRNLY